MGSCLPTLSIPPFRFISLASHLLICSIPQLPVKRLVSRGVCFAVIQVWSCFDTRPPQDFRVYLPVVRYFDELSFDWPLPILSYVRIPLFLTY